MLGALLGDIAGSTFERVNGHWDAAPRLPPGSRFTDDTVLTVATAAALLGDGDYAAAYHAWGRQYAAAGYGGKFLAWLGSDRPRPYGSWGNGAAMRVAPVGWACASLDATLAEAARSAAVTHDHPEGIKGAQAVAAAVFLARHGADKAELRAQLERRFGYALGRTLDAIRPGYTFDLSAAGSVPEALIAFLESTDYIDALRKAIGLGGDSDTLACIAGAVAEAHYRVLPDALLVPGCARLPDDLLQVSAKFAQCHPELPVRLAPGQACPGDGVTDAVVLLAGAARRAEVGELFAAYREALGPSVCVRDFDAELATLPGRYAEPGGALLLAVGNDGPLGCAGVRPAGGDTAELKRLYVLPRARGRGAGRRLLDAALAWTRQAGYQGIVLETLPSMRVARRLYLARGFRRVDEPVVAGGAAERYRLVFAQHLQPATPDP